jgi:hypothetical protein
MRQELVQLLVMAGLTDLMLLTDGDDRFAFQAIE